MKARTFAAVNGGEGGDEGEGNLEDLELNVYSVHCLDDSRDRRETARKAMRRWRC